MLLLWLLQHHCVHLLVLLAREPYHLLDTLLRRCCSVVPCNHWCC